MYHKKSLMSSPGASEHRMKSTVYFHHTETMAELCFHLFKTKLLLQKNMFFVLPFTVYSSCDLSACPVAQPHRVWSTSPPRQASLFLSGFLLQKKGLTHAKRALGLLAQSHDRADALLQSGAAATTGLCDAEERKGLLCSAEGVSR